MPHEFVNAEAFADTIDAAQPFQERAQSLGFDPINFDIGIFWRKAKQHIAHIATNEQGAPARLPDSFGDFHGFSEKRIGLQLLSCFGRQNVEHNWSLILPRFQPGGAISVK